MFGLFRNKADIIERRNTYYATILHQVYDMQIQKPRGTRFLYNAVHTDTLENDYNIARAGVEKIGMPAIHKNISFMTLSLIDNLKEEIEKNAQDVKSMAGLCALPFLARVALGYAPALAPRLAQTPHEVTNDMFSFFAAHYNSQPRDNFCAGVGLMCDNLKGWALEAQQYRGVA